ncbi:MAG: hypothetical protein Q8894_01455 [Sweet potato little leaf phytoplasma]|nr:hypothetical protein [Candidatus Phytoplasma australasiaticum]MDV3204447.1 hypothetical protein [Sweet potato little leaf phytoplasma]MDV3153801.1 hypothetical protein [Candidatus Phytoplasma australasiaticum]MDV3167664.1 hypothetical protein [Candidatus Phytoplasma australasiaticum]MDV3181080.1 hypothetical protein [Candidatus Phytoplasma australasiaticum]
MLVNQQIELLQTVILYQRPDLSKIMLPLIKVYRKTQKAQTKRQHHYQLITKRVGLLCKKYHYACGYRKITFLYRTTFGQMVNHKIILKIMKTNHWLMKWVYIKYKISMII